MNTPMTGIDAFIYAAFLALIGDQVIVPLIRYAIGKKGPRRGSLFMAAVDAVTWATLAAVYQNVWLLGAGLVYVLCELWRWWNNDDDDARRRREALRNRVTFRTFAPTPIPLPGAST